MGSGSLRIGSILGIEINLHWSFVALIILPLIFGLYLLFTVLLLLFLCVFIHELAHSITSLRNGVRVREIVLLPIGGASVIDEVGIDPKVEFNIAIVGPIMSLLLGGIFGILASFSSPGMPTFILQSLFELNIALGVLNILPAFPLDGGRVFRSYLERRHNELRATLITVRISKYIAALFVLVSFVYLAYINASFAYKEFEFFIYLLVALFLYGGAETEKQRMILKRQTKGLTISRTASQGFILVPKTAGIKKMYSLIQRRKKHIVITKTERGYMLVDLFRKRLTSAYRASDLVLPVPQLSPRTNVMDAMSRMEGSDRGIAVVVKNGRLIGIVTIQHLQAFISLHVMSKGKGFKG